jgi:hypothetical protein
MSKRKLVLGQRTIDIVEVLVRISVISDTSDEFRLLFKIDE